MAEFLTWIYLALAGWEISHEKCARINKTLLALAPGYGLWEKLENGREVPMEIEKFCCIISRYLLLPSRAGQIKSQQCLRNEPKIKHNKKILGGHTKLKKSTTCCYLCLLGERFLSPCPRTINSLSLSQRKSRGYRREYSYLGFVILLQKKSSGFSGYQVFRLYFFHSMLSIEYSPSLS